ncbi:MAG: replication-associated recombination protein A [Acidimicrobiales bacterium]
MTPPPSTQEPLGGGPSGSPDEQLPPSAPLAARTRPRTLDEIVGQQRLIGPGGALRAMIETDRLSSIILWGPPGTGKTTLARVVASRSERAFVAMSAVTAGVKDVREAVEASRQRLASGDRGTILFLDEVHRFNKSQQDALLPAVEAGVLTLIGATTENPFFEVNAPLLSRSTVFRLHPLSPSELQVVVDRGLRLEDATARPEAVAHLIEMADGDARAALTTVEVALSIARAAGRNDITLEDAELARQTRLLRYGEDEHFDIISAFIKSIRGSDPDAGLYWLARMLEAGEDPRYVARRLVILASEDVGMADSQGLVVADAAARAVEFVGLPEAALNLAHAVVYLATAPKSNTAMAALARATDDVRRRPAGAVPMPLRSVHPYQRNKLGEGGGYRYPHNEPSGFVAQEYRPAEIAGPIGSPERRLYYRPSPHGEESKVAERLRQLWGDAPYDSDEWWRFEKFHDPDR